MIVVVLNISVQMRICFCVLIYVIMFIDVLCFAPHSVFNCSVKLDVFYSHLNLLH